MSKNSSFIHLMAAAPWLWIIVWMLVGWAYGEVYLGTLAFFGGLATVFEALIQCLLWENKL